MDTYYTVVRKLRNEQWSPITGRMTKEEAESAFNAHMNDNPQFEYALIEITPVVVESYKPEKPSEKLAT